MADSQMGHPLKERRPASLVLQYRLEEELPLSVATTFCHVERWEVAVLGDGSSRGEERVEIGSARVLIFNLEEGDEIADFADRASGTWVDSKTSERWKIGTGEADNDRSEPTKHILLLDQVWVRPESRGQGLGPIIAAAVIDRLGRGCHLATCFPAPFELPDQDPAERARSIEALGKLWSQVGFSHWRDGVWMLSLDATDRHGPLVALLRASQSAAPGATGPREPDSLSVAPSAPNLPIGGDAVAGSAGGPAAGRA